MQKKNFRILLYLLIILIFNIQLCEKNPTSSEEITTGTVTDIDGNVYKTVKIGDQWWMAENLKVTHYRNGNVIAYIADSTQWLDVLVGAYCSYGNDENNVATYGYLYNWFAVKDDRNIAPVGWHLPTDGEWKELEIFLGISQSQVDSTGFRGINEGGKLKEASIDHWLSPNTGANNETGFTALPSGYCYDDGRFNNIGYSAIFWTATESSSYNMWARLLYYSQSGIYRYESDEGVGFSVRLVKD